uniref:Uncharacterized protein n=1 Tax=Rhizophora mucronata TaxID=61149 RepID=A0A2P2IMB1_RHIMU
MAVGWGEAGRWT